MSCCDWHCSVSTLIHLWDTVGLVCSNHYSTNVYWLPWCDTPYIGDPWWSTPHILVSRMWCALYGWPPMKHSTYIVDPDVIRLILVTPDEARPIYWLLWCDTPYIGDPWQNLPHKFVSSMWYALYWWRPTKHATYIGDRDVILVTPTKHATYIGYPDVIRPILVTSDKAHLIYWCLRCDMPYICDPRRSTPHILVTLMWYALYWWPLTKLAT
jgi:hypothetical protein